MEEKVKVKNVSIKRIGGYLHRIVPIADKSGKIISYALKPMMVEFKPRDIFQVVIGSALLAIPVSFTEEVWDLGETLPMNNIVLLALLSLASISVFIYFNFYRFNFKKHRFSFIKRVLGTYFISATVVGIILTLIQQCPWGLDNILAIKRIVLVSFPAAMGGTLSDTIK